MTPAVLSALAVAALLAGVLLAVVGVVGTHRPPAPTSAVTSRWRRLLGAELTERQRRTRRLLLIAAAAVCAAVWLVTGWPVVGLTAGIAVIGVPWLFTAGRAELQMIGRLEAVAAWTRRLRDLVGAGHGLVSAIVVSARNAPPLIADEVTALAAALQSGADPSAALDLFADRLGGFTSDEVIAALKLHAADRGQRLVEVLADVADDATQQAISRRGVRAARAEPRFVTPIMTVLILLVLALMLLDRTYARPYGVLVGELVLLGAVLLGIGLLAWIRKLGQPDPEERLLATALERARAPEGIRPATVPSAPLSWEAHNGRVRV